MITVLEVRTNACIEDENSHIGLDCLPNLHHLREQLRFLFMPTRGIDYDDIETFFLELGDTLSCNYDRIRLSV